MPNWVTVSSFATAGGTLVLAAATFASVRSANNAARTSERALQLNLRPLLFPSRLHDPPLKVGWVDEHWATVEGGCAGVELAGGNIYLAMSLHNVGAGIAVIHGWHPNVREDRAAMGHAEPDAFRLQSRDLFVPPGDINFWQSAIRDQSDPDYDDLRDAITTRRHFTIELLYGDHDGGQRTISKFNIVPRGDAADGGWLCTVVRHWNLDRPDPR